MLQPFVMIGPYGSPEWPSLKGGVYSALSSGTSRAQIRLKDPAVTNPTQHLICDPSNRRRVGKSPCENYRHNWELVSIPGQRDCVTH